MCILRLSFQCSELGPSQCERISRGCRAFWHCDSSRPFASVFFYIGPYADKLVAQLNGCATSSTSQTDDGLRSVPCVRLRPVPNEPQSVSEKICIGGLLLGGPFHSGAPRLCLPCLPSRDAACVCSYILLHKYEDRRARRRRSKEGDSNLRTRRVGRYERFCTVIIIGSSRVKKIMGLNGNSNSDMEELAKKTTDGDFAELANIMNDLFSVCE